MTRQLSAMSMFVFLIGFAADSYAVTTFSQDFDSETNGSAAGWTAGKRFFVTTPPVPMAGVISTDSVSPTKSLQFVGTEGGHSLHAWRNYGGLSSNGVDPVTVSFDFKIVSIPSNNFVEFTPFVFDTSLFGSAGTPGPDGGSGWPVSIRVLANGFVDYVEEGGNVELLPADTDMQGEWARVTATLNGSQDVDLSITMLTGDDAGASGSITDGEFQVSTPLTYYDNALDELRGFGFFTKDDNSAGFFNTNSILIDNFSVTIGVVPEPATGSLFGLGAIALFQAARRRRTN